MAQTLESQIREQIARYITGAITLDEFAEWFVPEALHLDEQAHLYPALADFAAHIDLLLIEHADGWSTEDELRRLLGLVVERERNHA